MCHDVKGEGGIIRLIVVRVARTTAYSVVCLLLTLEVAWGQQPKRRAEPEPLPLFPAEQAWLVTLDAPSAAGGAMDDLHVYVPLQTERLFALDRETGETVWMREIETEWPPLASGGLVYLAASDELHALDRETGDTRWRAALEAPLGAPMSADAGWLITVAGNGYVTAYRAADGARMWLQQMGAAPRSGAVFGEGDAVYVTLGDGRVGALNLINGNVLWEIRLPGLLSAPAWAPDRVFVGSDDNFFYALDPDDGSLKWKWRSGGDVIGAAIWEDTVFFASLDNIIRGVNRGNGNQRWRKETGTRPLMPPLAFARLAVVVGTKPTLTGFNARDGRPAGTYVAPADLDGPPLIDPDLKPFRVSTAIVMRNGQVAGLYPTALLFQEQLRLPLTALPGRVLQRERPPAASPR
jgi:outer membrane protein assembly factor BamB